MKVHELMTLLGKCPAGAEVNLTMSASIEELIKKDIKQILAAKMKVCMNFGRKYVMSKSNLISNV